MAKSTTLAAAPATPAAIAATDTAPVAKSTVVSTETQAPGPKPQASTVQAEIPNSLEKSLADIGIKFGSNDPKVLEPASEAQPPAETGPGKEPAPGADDATKEKVDDDGESTAETAEAETSGDPEAETTLDESSSEWPESALHEVTKLRQQKRELKTKAADAVTRLTELETRLAEAESKAAEEAETGSRGAGEPASRSTELQDVKTVAELQRRTTEAEQLLEWCDDQLIALRVDPGSVEQALKANKVALSDRDGVEDFSRDRMEGFLLNTRRKVDTTLRKHVPARERFLSVNAESERNAKQLFPWYADKSSPEYQISQQIIRLHPEIQQWPDWKIAVGIQVRGLQEMRKAAASSKSQAPSSKTVIAPRIPGIPAKVPGRVDTRAAALTSAGEQIRNPRNGEQVVNAISTLLSQTK